MKTKKMLAMGLSAVLACSGMAFAAEPADIDLAQPAIQQTAQAAVPRMRDMVTVLSIREDSLLVKTLDEHELQLNLSAQTLVVDNATGRPAARTDIQTNDTIYVYYSPAMTRSIPPQSACELILVNVGEQTPASLHEAGEVTREEAQSSILTADGSLIIRVDEKTTYAPLLTRNIVTLDDLTPGTRFLAWYDIIALSYPGQTSTAKIVILPAIEPNGAKPESAETPAAPAEKIVPPTPVPEITQYDELKISADGKLLDVKAQVQNGVAILPVRTVAEALGCEVSYERKDGKEFVTVIHGMRKMVLEIGLDLYQSTTRMEGATGSTKPEPFGVAPYIKNNSTYAAANMFSALVGFTVTQEQDTLLITAQK